LSGLALNRLIPHNSTLMNRITFTGDAIFIPFFLLSVGMILNAKVLFGDLRTWGIAIGMSVTVIATKWAAAQAARKIFGYSEPEGKVMFGLSVVQAAATLAAVMVGHRIGLFDEAVINGTIVMILVTCVLGPYVVNLSIDKMAVTAANSDSFIANPLERIVIPLVELKQVEPAVELALLLKSSGSQVPVYPAYFVPEGAEYEQKMSEADKVLLAAVNQVNASGHRAEAIKRVHTSAGRGMSQVLKELRSKLVIVPWDVVPSRSGAKLGRMIDDLVQEGEANLILSRLIYPLSGSRRMNVIFPPIGELTSDNLAAIKIINLIAKQLGIGLQIFCHDQDLKNVKTAFESSDKTIKKAFVSYRSVRMWFSTFSGNTEKQDLLVLVGLRKKSQSESNATEMVENETMAHSIAGKYSEQNFLVVFGTTMPESNGTAKTHFKPRL